MTFVVDVVVLPSSSSSAATKTETKWIPHQQTFDFYFPTFSLKWMMIPFIHVCVQNAH